MKPQLIVTMGDPSGVGPEILAKSLTRPSVRLLARWIIMGDKERFLKALKIIKKPVPKGMVFVSADPSRSIGDAPLVFLDFNNVPANLPFGKKSYIGGGAAGDYLRASVRFIQKNPGARLVTLPISKASIQTGLWKKKDVGHTEFLARLTKRPKAKLMMVMEPLRVVHVTSHVPLKAVASLITKKRVFETVELTHQGLRRLGIKTPRIAVCSLNPHGGEHGLLGREEITQILPALNRARKKKIRAEGPFPADSLWPKVSARYYDAVVAMYHDQGQIPIKLSSMNFKGNKRAVGGVNFTLGLPFIRTSVAHGTAFDLAGQGTVSEQSFIQAAKMAVSSVES